MGERRFDDLSRALSARVDRRGLLGGAVGTQRVGEAPRFDELARALTRPMPRRRALRLIGSAVAATAVAGWRPPRAQAVQCDPGSTACGQNCCPTGSKCYPDRPFIPGIHGLCCYPPDLDVPCQNNGQPYLRGFCCPNRWTCCPGFVAASGTSHCCEPGKRCVGNDCVGSKCPPGQRECFEHCCHKDEECYRPGKRCRKKCTEGRLRCGDRCCPPGEICDPQTKKCKCPQAHKCGDDCCDPYADETCCGYGSAANPKCCTREKCCNDKCCEANEICDFVHSSPPKCRRCPKGQRPCGRECCPKGMICKAFPGGGFPACRCPTGQIRCGDKCCPPGYRLCRNGVCKKCPSGQDPCGDICCPPGRECAINRCICPSGTVECGSACCTGTQICQNGTCMQCPSGQEPCGTICCPPGSTCNLGVCS